MYYFDTSALVKLVVEEAETKALQRFINSIEPVKLVTSALTRAELARAACRYGEEALHKAREVLDAIAEVTITEALLDLAGVLRPPALRTLDVIHLATAIELGTELAGFVAYDARLLTAAHQASISTLTPV
jgi:predicted nucleic acid-binding protein